MQREIEILREENRQLRQLLSPRFFIPVKWSLHSKEKLLLCALLARDMITKEQAYHSLYHYYDYQPDIDIVRVFISKIRRKLNPHGLHIKTINGQGYFLENRLTWHKRLSQP